MFTENLKDNSIRKLEGILRNRYGMGFRLASIVDAQDVEVGDSKGELRGGALYVTICARGKYLATAVLNGAEKLSNPDVDAVTEMVKLVLEPALYSSFLEKQEQNVSVQSTDQDDHQEHSNLISMFQSPTPINNWTKEGPAFMSSMLLLESGNSQTIQRVSVHIHELSERWALLNYRDVRHQLHTLQDLRELGAMTLVIHDVTALTRAEQELLVKFQQNVKNSTVQSEPMILLGSAMTWPELQAQKILIPELLSELEATRLELDRLPQEFSRLKSALELFLDRNAVLI